MGEATGGPPRFFALWAAAPGTVLAGTCGRGSSRSVDGGRTWTPAADAPAPWVNAFAGGDGALLACTAGEGLHRSVDGGASWRPLGPAGTTLYCATVVGAALLVGTEGEGVLRSDDDGASWSPAAAELGGSTVYRLVPAGSGSVLVATAGRGLWVLDPTAGTATPAGLDGCTLYAAALLPGGRLLAGVKERGLLGSDDGGATWVDRGEGLPDPLVHVLAPVGGEVLAGTGRGVARSDDGGERWRPLGEGLAERRVFSLAVTREGTVLAGSYDGVFALPSGSERWEPLDTGLSEDAFAVAFDAAGGAFAGMGDGELRCSPDGGTTWMPAGRAEGAAYAFLRLTSGEWLAGDDGGVLAGDGTSGRWRRHGLTGERVFCLAEPEPGVVLAGTLGSGVRRWTSGTRRWEAVSGIDHPMVFDLLVRAGGRVLAASGAVVAGAKTGGISRSEDGGRTWQAADAPPVMVYRLVETATGALFAGAQRSLVLRSVDGGATWQPRAGAGPGGDKLYALAAAPDGRLYLGAGAALWCSDDEAETWKRVDDAALDGVTVFDLASGGDGSMLAATSAGILRRPSGGGAWEPVSPPPPPAAT